MAKLLSPPQIPVVTSDRAPYGFSTLSCHEGAQVSADLETLFWRDAQGNPNTEWSDKQLFITPFPNLNILALPPEGDRQRFETLPAEKHTTQQPNEYIELGWSQTAGRNLSLQQQLPQITGSEMPVRGLSPEIMFSQELFASFEIQGDFESKPEQLSITPFSSHNTNIWPYALGNFFPDSISCTSD